jgi:hypothetical protein
LSTTGSTSCPAAVITPAEARHGLRLIDEALSALGN